MYELGVNRCQDDSTGCDSTDSAYVDGDRQQFFLLYSKSIADRRRRRRRRQGHGRKAILSRLGRSAVVSGTQPAGRTDRRTPATLGTHCMQTPARSRRRSCWRNGKVCEGAGDDGMVGTRRVPSCLCFAHYRVMTVRRPPLDLSSRDRPPTSRCRSLARYTSRNCRRFFCPPSPRGLKFNLVEELRPR